MDPTEKTAPPPAGLEVDHVGPYRGMGAAAVDPFALELGDILDDLLVVVVVAGRGGQQEGLGRGPQLEIETVQLVSGGPAMARPKSPMVSRSPTPSKMKAARGSRLAGVRV